MKTVIHIGITVSMMAKNVFLKAIVTPINWLAQIH